MSENKKNINFRCSEEVYNWYKHFAELEEISMSELFRKIPELYDQMDIDVDILNTENITLKKELKKHGLEFTKEYLINQDQEQYKKELITK